MSTRPKMNKQWWEAYYAVVREVHHSDGKDGFYPSAAKSVSAIFDALGLEKYASFTISEAAPTPIKEA